LGVGGYAATATVVDGRTYSPEEKEVSSTGANTTGSLSLGTPILDSLVVGASASVGYALGGRKQDPYNDGTAVDTVFAGPFLLFRPSSFQGFSIQGLGLRFEGGYASAALRDVWSWSGDKWGHTDRLFSGIYLSGLLGWDWPLAEDGNNSLGIAFRFSYIHASSSEDSTHTLNAILPFLAVQYTYF